MMATLLAGWGIWYPHDYPNGFRRPRVNQEVALVSCGGSRALVTLATGETVQTDERALRFAPFAVPVPQS